MPEELNTHGMSGNLQTVDVFGIQCTSQKALIVEDLREADIELKRRGCSCDRITHNEFMTTAGSEYTGRLLKGDYSVLLSLIHI